MCEEAKGDKKDEKPFVAVIDCIYLGKRRYHELWQGGRIYFHTRICRMTSSEALVNMKFYVRGEKYGPSALKEVKINLGVLVNGGFQVDREWAYDAISHQRKHLQLRSEWLSKS